VIPAYEPSLRKTCTSASQIIKLTTKPKALSRAPFLTQCMIADLVA
jgi:hypothetical protein